MISKTIGFFGVHHFQTRPYWRSLDQIFERFGRGVWRFHSRTLPTFPPTRRTCLRRFHTRTQNDQRPTETDRSFSRPWPCQSARIQRLDGTRTWEIDIDHLRVDTRDIKRHQETSRDVRYVRYELCEHHDTVTRCVKQRPNLTRSDLSDTRQDFATSSWCEMRRICPGVVGV